MKNLLITFVLVVVLATCAPANSPSINEETPPSSPVSLISTTTLLSTETPTATLAITPIKTSTITPTMYPTPVRRFNRDPGLLVTLGDGLDSSRGIPLFSADGNLIALATITRIRIWDTHTYELVHELDNPYNENCYLEDAAFSDDGDYFAVSITSCWNYFYAVQPGHLLVWDMSTGDLIHEWDQEYAYMVDSRQGEFSIPVYAMTFLPNSTNLAYATGNSIAIRDVEDIDSDPEYLSLGHDMYATKISVRDDSQYLFVLMEWEKWIASKLMIEYKLQSWHLAPNYLNFTRGYPEVDPGDEHWSLHTDNILHHDHVNGILEVRNLTTNTISQFPYQTGWKYFNSDLSLMINARLFGLSNDEERSLDLWNTDTGELLYSFFPDFGTRWYYVMHEIAFSPDNTLLAIQHRQQVSLWNINSVVNAEP